MRPLRPIANQLQGRILDFDIETTPLAWYGGDLVTSVPMAIGYRFVGDRQTKVSFLKAEDWDNSMIEMLEDFRKAYDQADVVTGHWIRGFDLPKLNAAYLRADLPLLGPKMTSDTKSDLGKLQGLSKSQENLGALFELHHPKIPMTVPGWEKAMTCVEQYRHMTKKRVVGDVKQHIELREELIRRGALGPPRPWSGKASGRSGRYVG